MEDEFQVVENGRAQVQNLVVGSQPQFAKTKFGNLAYVWFFPHFIVHMVQLP
jgi:hypothetical protein